VKTLRLALPFCMPFHSSMGKEDLQHALRVGTG
jgi:hypothetical protein